MLFIISMVYIAWAAWTLEPSCIQEKTNECISIETILFVSQSEQDKQKPTVSSSAGKEITQTSCQYCSLVNLSKDLPHSLGEID